MLESKNHVRSCHSLRCLQRFHGLVQRYATSCSSSSYQDEQSSEIWPNVHIRVGIHVRTIIKPHVTLHTNAQDRVVGAGIARTYYLGKVQVELDKYHYAFNVEAASLAEINVAIICACAPSLKHVTGVFFRNMKTLSTKGS